GAGVDFVVIADHGSCHALADGWEGYRDGVLIIVATEISCAGGEHILVFGVPETRDLMRRPSAEVLRVVASRGGKAFVAHPRAARVSWRTFSAGDWDGWDLPGFIGIEIWSLMHDVYDGVKPWQLLRFHRKFLRRAKGPSAEVMRHWDDLCKVRRVAAIGALDSHARPVRIVGRPLITYGEALATLRTHVLAPPMSGEPDADTRNIVEAIIEGRCFAALDGLADAGGFSFSALGAEGEPICPGAELKFDGPVQLCVTSPHEAELSLLKDGEAIAVATAKTLEAEADEAGVYRVEARIGGRPWVFTNPIYLRA
ncbi:MAG: hypothetical protein QGD94_12910, partial [Planctomycetia bacterium]|nr:hypothetical protein [Planctomycetia bacterium]